MVFSVLDVTFVTLALIVFIWGVLIYSDTIANLLPVFVVQGFRYGKFGYRGIPNKYVKTLEVPKSWFWHIYLFAFLYATFVTCVALNIYLLKGQVPAFYGIFLNPLTTGSARNEVNATSTMIALTLLMLHTFRRFYESKFIIVPSSAKMNLIHYFVGFLHFFGLATASVMYSDGFILAENKDIFDLGRPSVFDVMSVILFLWASYHQHKAFCILADLRKDKTGKPVSDKYAIPKGDWFEFLSMPHYFAEILIYSAFTLVLWHNDTYWIILFWVVSNQIITGLVSHKWYREKFDNYPKKRKAIFPYLL